MISPLAARCCHGSCHAHHRTSSHAPQILEIRSVAGGSRVAALQHWPRLSPGPLQCQVSRHCLCQPRPARPGHHTNYCTVYSTSTHNRKPLIIICYKIFLFPRNKEAFPKYQQLHLSTVNCSRLPQSSHHSDHSPCGKP